MYFRFYFNFVLNLFQFFSVLHLLQFSFPFHDYFRFSFPFCSFFSAEYSSLCLVACLLVAITFLGGLAVIL